MSGQHQDREYELVERSELRTAFDSRGDGGGYGAVRQSDNADAGEESQLGAVGGSNSSFGFGECTVFETASNLVSVLSGSAMLSLPFAASALGWVGVPMILILARMFMYSFQLLAECVETQYEYERHESKRPNTHIFFFNIDYLTLGKRTFGEHVGDKLVLIAFGSEMLLALVSFIMNIGLNINVINPNLSVLDGTMISSIISIVLAMIDLKMAAYSSAIGMIMTIFIIFAIMITGWQLETGIAHDQQLAAASADASAGGGPTSDVRHLADEREYVLFDPTGLPVALGIMAFSFGGHGTL